MSDFPDMQRLLDEVTRWQKVETIQLHAITCDCEACKAIQERERKRRWEELYERREVKKF